MSSPTLVLLSRIVPLKVDFNSFMLALGAQIDSQSDLLNGAIETEGKWISDGNWIVLYQPSPQGERDELTIFMDEFGNEAMQKLGEPPKTYIIVTTYRPANEQDWPKIRTVAAKLVLGFMQRWPSICSTEEGHIYGLAGHAAHASSFAKSRSV